jgi:hypothetical protein
MRAMLNGPRDPPSDADVDAQYGLEPVLDVARADAADPEREFVTVSCPYCGEPFETRVDASAGAAHYIEDCQVCCQPIEMTLDVDAEGAFAGLTARRGD